MSKETVRDTRTHVGQELAAHRKRRGLTQAEVSRRSGMTPQTIYRVERKRGMNLATAVRYLYACGAATVRLAAQQADGTMFLIDIDEP